MLTWTQKPQPEKGPPWYHSWLKGAVSSNGQGRSYLVGASREIVKIKTTQWEQTAAICSELVISRKSATIISVWQSLNVRQESRKIYTVSLPCPWILHPQIQQTGVKNIWKDTPESSKGKTWICYALATIYMAFISVVKKTAAKAGDARDMGFGLPGWGRSPGVGNGNLLQYSWPGKFYGQRSLVCYPWGHRVRHDWVAEHAQVLWVN